MKLRLKALMLALGLTAFSFSTGVCAEETEVAEAAEEVVEEAAEEESEAEESSETEASSTEDYYKELFANYLTLIGSWTDSEVESYMESDDEITALVAYNWNTVKSELGGFVEVLEITDMETTNSGYGGVITATASYDGVGSGSTVTVTLTYEYTYSSTYAQYIMSLSSLEWDVDYTFAVLMQKAALNTAMGIAIVFLSLLFLSFLIGKIHYIPEMLEAKKKENEPIPAPKPAAPAPAPVVEEVSLTDDLELIAVITAAIAAAREEESAVSTGDSYVVRSIRKVNNRNWRRA